MLKNKQLLFLGPEIYLVFATIYYWFLTSNLFNFVAIGLLVILGYQIIFKKAVTGIILGSIFTFLNIFMVFALLSELGEFPTANDKYYQLLTYGSLFFGLNIIVCILMLTKYIRREIKVVN